MAISEKQTQRLKYKRALERFISAVIGYLVKDKKANFMGFQIQVLKQYEFLKKVEPTYLYKENLQIIENFVQQLLNITNKECKNFNQLKSELLYKSNQIHKQKNLLRYKKDKHPKFKFQEWD